MREMERKTSNDKSLSSREESKESKPHLNHEHKSLYEDEDRSKTAETKSHSDFKVSDLNAGTDSSDVYEEVVIHYMDDVYRSEVAVTNGNIHEVAAHVNRDEIRDLLSECTKEIKENNKHFPVKDNPTKKEEEPDCGTVDSISSQGGTQTRDSISSQGGTQTSEDHKADRPSKAPKKLVKEHSLESCPRSSRASRDQKEAKKLVPKTSHDTKKKASKTSGASGKKAKPLSDNKSKNMKIPSKPASESSAGDDDKLLEEVKEIDILDEPPNGAHSVGTDEETADMEENGFDEDKVDTLQKIEEKELRIEKLEEELREIASLEIALYSVVPEHGSSAHKIHTPARRISRLYIHACKHWNQDRRASIARSAVSGLVLIAKACGNDVSRLTFWWSNTVVLRGIISQAFGNSHHSSPNGWLVESNGNGKKSGGRPSTLKWRGIPGSKEGRTLGFTAIVDDWQETGTFTAALEKIESWIYSRIIESVWWQTLTPHMQSPVEDLYTEKSFGRLLGPALGDQQQGSFSVNLWKRAFLDAFQRLCPIRAGGHECGCLPVLARMVMEKCVARLDVAMFNAILRESANEIPTDPVSDPIIDSKVLPIPAGDLSFGSGAQLKNSIGNWSRWLTDLFGIDADDSPQEDHQINGVDDDSQDGDVVSKSFHLLNALSDLLMLPKDMLIDRSIRKEVCPSLGLPLIKRILCNFTPDEFCPDPVPGALLEALNAESIIERRLSDKELISGFPCNAAPVVYCPPLSAHVAEKVADAGEHPLLGRNASIVQRKGYTSDDELDELDSPFASIIDKIPADASAGNGRPKELCNRGVVVARYDLLREVWLA